MRPGIPAGPSGRETASDDERHLVDCTHLEALWDLNRLEELRTGTAAGTEAAQQAAQVVPLSYAVGVLSFRFRRTGGPRGPKTICALKLGSNKSLAHLSLHRVCS